MESGVCLNIHSHQIPIMGDAHLTESGVQTRLRIGGKRVTDTGSKRKKNRGTSQDAKGFGRRQKEPDPPGGRDGGSISSAGAGDGDYLYPEEDFPLRGRKLSADGYVPSVCALLLGVPVQAAKWGQPAV